MTARGGKPLFGICSPNDGFAPKAALRAGPLEGPLTVHLDLALGLQVARAAKAAGVTPDALIEDTVRFYLEIGPDAVARLRSGRA